MIYLPGTNAHLNLNTVSCLLELDLIRAVNHVRQCIFNFNGCGVLVSAEFAECGVPANNHCHQLRLNHYLGNVFQVSSSAGGAALCEVRSERKCDVGETTAVLGC